MIYVFKTSVKTEKDIKKIKSSLDSLLSNKVWNFDLEDCDKVLRIDSPIDQTNSVIDLLEKFGYDCQELPD